MVGKTGKKVKTVGRGTARGRGALSTRNGELEHNAYYLRECEVFLESLEQQIRRMEERKKEELRLLDVQELEFFHRTCNLYTVEQLDMPVSLLEKLLEEEENSKLQHANDPPAVDHNDVPDEPIHFKIPIKPMKKKRRSSVIQSYNSATATPAWRPSRGPKMPKFVSAGTGIKNMKPRLARMGEVAYSDNGSPIVVGDSTKKPVARQRKMALVSESIDV